MIIFALNRITKQNQYMINLKQILLLTLVLVGLGTYAQNDAVAYMEKIGEETKKIQTDMWEYTNAVSHGKSARKVEKRRGELLRTSQQALNRVKNMPAYDGSSVYRDSVASFLRINYLVLKEDYAKIVDMEEIAEKSYDNMEAYLLAQEEANNKMRESAEMVRQEQASFAAKHNITLINGESDELTEKMKIASEVYKYYNEVYLIFFKSYVQETYLIAAMLNKDVSGIEQNKNALETTSSEGLKMLETVKSFKGDNTVVVACRNMLKFYNDEAANHISDITDFYLKTENFNAVKESFDQKKEKDRTQEDVDQYNTAVNEMNQAIEVYNSTNESLNKNRSELLEQWNKTVAKFTDKHVPRGKAK